MANHDFPQREHAAPALAASMSLGLAIATCRRADILREMLLTLRHQSRQPDRIFVCHTAPADIAGIDPGTTGSASPVEFLCTAPGLPRQRNAILDAARDCDIVLFIDDDFVMSPGYIAAVVAAFGSEPDIVATTGFLIHDDVKGPGLDVAGGLALIAADAAKGGAQATGWEKAPHGYGCNMALRMHTVRNHELRFDERLPLYAWSEDIDFTHRMARHGVIAKLRGARGVHLGVKLGRSPGRRLGYSQVANPLYLLRKGSYSVGRAARSVGRNVAANCARALWPEPYIDRRGRLAGTARAMLDMCRGRMRPERILDL